MVLFVVFLCLGFRSPLSPLFCFLIIVWRFMIRCVSSTRYNAHQMRTKSACHSELYQNEGWDFARVKNRFVTCSFSTDLSKTVSLLQIFFVYALMFLYITLFCHSLCYSSLLLLLLMYPQSYCRDIWLYRSLVLKLTKKMSLAWPAVNQLLVFNYSGIQ